MTPEQKARINIDNQLEKCGWIIQDMKEFNPVAGTGIVVREYPTDSGSADYILFINREPVGVVEAKAETKGENITIVEEQTEKYEKSK